MRRFAALAGLIASVALASMSVAQAPSVLVSGQTGIAMIDGNGNGPGYDDCMFTATLLGSALSIFATQDSNVPLRACAGDYFGTALKGFDTSSNFGDVNLMSSTHNVGSLPLLAELVDETGMPSSGAPLRFDSPTDSVTITGGAQGSGILCSAGGPASRVSFPGVTSLLVPLSFFPTSGTPQFLCIPSLPLQRSDNFQFALFNAYIPVTANEHITMALSNAPSTLLVDVDLNALPPCLGTAAPTVTEWGLMASVLCLLVMGTWRLGRRPAFYQSLAML